jgi:hypothetical protein
LPLSHSHIDFFFLTCNNMRIRVDNSGFYYSRSLVLCYMNYFKYVCFNYLTCGLWIKFFG